MSNLDDLFSKRDKKKKTTKTKFSTLDANEFAKQLESTAIAAVVRAEEDENQVESVERPVVAAVPIAAVVDNLDEEWKPFDSDENKDYTGLKIIQNWKADDREIYSSVNDDGDKKNRFVWGSSAPGKADDAAEDDELNENDQEKTSNDAPVKNTDDKGKGKGDEENKDPAAPVDPVPTPPVPSTGGAYVPPALRRTQQPTSVVPEKPAESTTTGSKYVLPHLRGGNDSAIPSTSVNYRRPNKSQPNLNDAFEFPTLDTVAPTKTTPEKQVNGEEKFELSKKSARNEPKSNESMINLDNKFNALSTNN